MENTTFTNIAIIDKEEVVNLKFPSEPVVVDPSKKDQLMTELHRATSLGNLSKHKVNIIFEDNEGVKKVNTTIWAITEKSVLLKKGVFLPIHRIRSVDLL
ncbi:MAG: hypothetical protein LAT54_10615 [Cryomorphaceae bacterium]|nr:hypothetical protein [Cryomorphaceae bacterium]